MNKSSGSGVAARECAFMDALSGVVPERTPVWLMRQAGRSLPEYRAIRGTGSILEAVKDPTLACEITLQPVRRYDVDAAILYSDIIVPVHAAGFGIEIIPGQGPVTEHPFKSKDDLNRLQDFSAAALTPYVLETIQLLKKELSVPLIGFAGGPFTVASYLIEGRPSRTFTKTKAFMASQPELFATLLERLTEITIDFLSAQIASGVDAIQIFDSWVGALSTTEYERFISSQMHQIFSDPIISSVPTIHFGVKTEPLLELIAKTKPSAIGVDFNTSISTTAKRLGPDFALQGNLDPQLCLKGSKEALEGATRVLIDSATAPKYVFNLGHGVLPETDPVVIKDLVSFVHENGLKIRGEHLNDPQNVGTKP